MALVIPALTPYQVRGRLRNPVFPWIPASAGMTAFGAIYVAVFEYRLNCLEYFWVKGSNKMTFYVIFVLINGKFIYT